ncbi:MAG TPA: DUF805 domain-containing protein [Caulobacteraceae bacterium]|jgi:uncharacterized membrane protein YhaH (DUF805 family)|nr:DUF805 domain-containing protein [Caulobacteraceae bacterium]
MMQTLFNMNGRIRRSTFWLYSIGSSVVLLIAVFAVGMLAQMINLPIIGLVVGLVAYIALIWIELALYIKRLHDKDMMWGWIFCPIYPAIVAMFLDGTPGPNKYGPSPKGLTGATVAT